MYILPFCNIGLLNIQEIPDSLFAIRTHKTYTWAWHFCIFFYTNIDLEWNYTCDKTWMIESQGGGGSTDQKIGRLLLDRATDSISITVELSWAARGNLIVEMFLSDIYMKYLVALHHHQPHTWNTNLLYLPPPPVVTATNLSQLPFFILSLPGQYRSYLAWLFSFFY